MSKQCSTPPVFAGLCTKHSNRKRRGENLQNDKLWLKILHVLICTRSGTHFIRQFSCINHYKLSNTNTTTQQGLTFFTTNRLLLGVMRWWVLIMVKSGGASQCTRRAREFTFAWTLEQLASWRRCVLWTPIEIHLYRFYGAISLE